MLQMGKLRPRFSHLTKLVHHGANVETGVGRLKAHTPTSFWCRCLLYNFLIQVSSQTPSQEGVLCGADGGGCHDALASVPNRRAQKPQHKVVESWGIQSQDGLRSLKKILRLSVGCIILSMKAQRGSERLRNLSEVTEGHC